MKYIHELVWDYRQSSDLTKQFIKTRLSRKPIETTHCNYCNGNGIIESQFGEDDIDRDVCEFCENYEARLAIKIADAIKTMFIYLSLKYKKEVK
tara:strand:+ start:180 stop:461 length:282 start_codon:yes stop_codon:yes gene_type:complete